MKRLQLMIAVAMLATLVVTQADAQTVTITLTDHTGATVTPILDEPVPGLTGYAGRHSFDGRTGGATADQDTRNITSVYDGGDPVAYLVTEGWQEVHNQSWTPQVLEDGFLRVAADGVGSQSNNVSWDQQFGGSYTTAVHNFDIRISQGDPAANDKADGFGWRYINSALDGETGAAYVAGEEPNIAGTLGVGFDIWDNGEVDNNANTSVSLHWDNALLKTVNLQTETSVPFSLETGEPINVNVAITVPEPSSIAIMSLGVLGMMGIVRRRRKV